MTSCLIASAAWDGLALIVILIFRINAQYYKQGGPVFYFDSGEQNASPLVPYFLYETAGPSSVMTLARRFNGPYQLFPSYTEMTLIVNLLCGRYCSDIRASLLWRPRHRQLSFPHQQLWLCRIWLRGIQVS